MFLVYATTNDEVSLLPIPTKRKRFVFVNQNLLFTKVPIKIDLQ